MALGWPRGDREISNTCCAREVEDPQPTPVPVHSYRQALRTYVAIFSQVVAAHTSAMADRARSRSPPRDSTMPHRAGSGGSNGKGKGGIKMSVFEFALPIYTQIKTLRNEADRLQEEMTKQASLLQELEDFIEKKMWHGN